MQEVLLQDIQVLIWLRDKIYNFIQQNRKPLHQVLRYWMYEYVVPLDIEWVIKYLVLNYGDLTPGKNYQFVHKHSHDFVTYDVIIEFSFEKNGNQYSVLQSRDTIQKDKKEFRLTRYDDRREVVYQDQVYRSVADSGTVYRHLMTQYRDVRDYSLQDYQAGLISAQEQLAFEILHLFHDIPEMGTMEMCNNQTKTQWKTEQQSQSEYARWIEIIDSWSDLSGLEKNILRTIYTEDTKKSLFKAREHLRWLTYDNMLIYAHRIYHTNRKKLIGEMSFSFLHELTDTYYFLSGKSVIPIELDSIKNHLREHRAWIDFMLSQTEQDYFPYVHPQRQGEFEDKKKIWEDIKEIL
jgi:hypothetical protein